MNLYKYNINNKNEKELTQFNWVIKEIIGFDNGGEGTCYLNL